MKKRYLVEKRRALRSLWSGGQGTEVSLTASLVCVSPKNICFFSTAIECSECFSQTWQYEKPKYQGWRRSGTRIMKKSCPKFSKNVRNGYPLQWSPRITGGPLRDHLGILCPAPSGCPGQMSSAHVMIKFLRNYEAPPSGLPWVRRQRVRHS